MNYHKNEPVWVQCSCGSEVVRIEYDNELDEKGCKGIFYFSMYNSSYFDKPSLGWILKYIWHLLRTRKPYADEVILDKDEALKLAEYIKNNLIKE